MSKQLAKIKVKHEENHRTPKATDHVYQSGNQVLVWAEKQINNRVSMYRSPFTVFSSDADSKIAVIEEELGEAPKRYNTAQVRLYAEDPEEVAASFIASHSKAFPVIETLMMVLHGIRSQHTA